MNRVTFGSSFRIFFVLITAAIFSQASLSALYAETPPVPPVLEQLNNAFITVAEKITPAVVNISSSKKESGNPLGDLDQFKNHPFPFKDFFDDYLKKNRKNPKEPGEGNGGFRQQGMGSGVVITPDGYVLTNSHVVKDADEIKVTLSDKRSFPAKLVGADPESDIAVVKIEATKLAIATLGDSSKIKVGEIVFAVGTPFGLDRSVTQGIVSATGRSDVRIIDYEDFIQTDAAINPGNSGGPLVNIRGEVIGINTAIATRSGGYQGVGFAIPSNSAKIIMEELKSTGKVQRGLLGVNIQDVTEPLAKSYGRTDIEGALVAQVIEGSAAEKAGIKNGDIILKFNGKPVANAQALKNMVGVEKPETQSTLTIWRKAALMDVKVTIGERPAKMAGTTPHMQPSTQSAKLGIAVEKVPPARLEDLGLKEGQGVVIKEVNPDGVGARKLDLRPGDIILEVDDKPINSPEEFASIAEQAKDSIRLRIQRGTAKTYVAAPLK
jgi:serine protease Do